MIRPLALAVFALPLASCAIIPDTPRVGQEAAAQGTPVKIRQSVWAGDAILTPLAVTEDSRCPQNARCVRAGELKVSTRITSTHWAQTAEMTLGKPHEILGRTYTLVSGLPEKQAERETDAGDYSFVYERR